MSERASGRDLVSALLSAVLIAVTLKQWKAERSPIGQEDSASKCTSNESGNNQPRQKIFAQPEQKGWNPEESRHHRIERRYWCFTTAFAFVAALGAIATVVLSNWSLDEARKATGEVHRQANAAEESLRATRKNFIIDQRPYIWLSNLGAPQIWNDTDGRVQIIWSWFYVNYGKTPSREATVTQFMRLGNGPFKLSFGEKGYDIAAPLPPNKNGDHATDISEPISRDDATKYLSSDIGVSISIEILYQDAYRNSYETDVCIGKLKTGDIAYERPAKNCKNDIK